MKAEGSLENAIRVLRRRKVVLLVALISVPLAAYLVSSLQQKKYTATATLLFESGEAGSSEASREAATNEALAGLPAVAVRTAKRLGPGVSASEILKSVSTSSANEMANLTTISATTDSPDQSARIANAYSRAYVAFRRKADQAQVMQVIELVKERLGGLPPGAATGGRGRALRERLSQLEVEQALKTGGAQLVQLAGVPTSPSSPRTKRNALIGIVLGLILGIALVALLERVDRRVRSVEELDKLFGLPILARIPRSRALADGSIKQILEAPEAEPFRILRTNLHYFHLDREHQSRSILIASPEPNDGKSTVARGLAGAMAEMGDHVILVEADLRKESAFRPDARSFEGLSTVLAGGTPLDKALTEVTVSSAASGSPRKLTVLPSGPVPPNPTELLESAVMQELLVTLDKLFEAVVIDSPALGIVSDAMTLVPFVSGALAVGGLGKTTRDGVEKFMAQFSIAGKQPIGLVATFTRLERNQYSYYRRSSNLFRS